MTLFYKTGNSNRRSQRLLRFGASALLVSLATMSHAESLYPQEVKPAKTADVIRSCTTLEISAELTPSECGTLTLSEVVQRISAIRNLDNSK